MALFPVLELEKVVQVGDKTRLDATKSFVSKGEAAVSLVRIKPEASESFITVTGSNAKDWFLDWAYATAGTKTVTVEITTDGAPITKDFEILSVSEADDMLFSNDKDLIEFESEILKYIKPGRASWLNMHRKAQELIVDWVNSRGNIQTNMEKFTKADFLDVSEVNEWSTALTLQLIFKNLSNAIGDIFEQKSKHYESMALDKRSRAVLRLDLDSDGQLDDGEYVGLTSIRMLRR